MSNTIQASLSRPARTLSKSITSTATATAHRAKLRRRYHSHQHLAPGAPFTPAESAILSASLLHVPSHGFSNAALSLGARDAGFLDVSINLLPRGAFDLVRYHLVTERLRLGSMMDFRKPVDELPEELRDLGVPAKIRALCMERLRANSPIIHRWQEALALMSLAGNIPASISELAKLSDEIWFLAGDESHDTTWYTKRVTLSGVYASTELFMTQDNSKDFEATWEFLDRRLGDVKIIGAIASNFTSYLDFTAHAFANVLRSKNVPFF